MLESQSAAIIEDAVLLLDDEKAKLRQMTTRIEALSDQAAANRSDNCLDRTKATIELLQQRIEWLQIISRRSL
ncbi:MAG: hypothetical protein LBO72_00230 [Helicobacteraceae bacterium]|jgi:hypothetical protein|nr:hypothetical protein [Helicobacteraceae bacterium]